MSVHQAALVLADHLAYDPYTGRQPDLPVRCGCGWIGPDSDHPAHQADMLARAGLLAAGTPPETPPARVLDARAADAARTGERGA